MKIKAGIVKAIICIFVVLALLVSGGYYTRHTAYKKVMVLMQEEKYEQAIANLEFVNNGEINGNTFHITIHRTTAPKDYYRDSAALYAYAKAREEYASGNRTNVVNMYLTLILDNYDGALSEDIKQFKEIFAPEYAEYQAEMKRRTEEEIARLKGKIPYIGMKEEYIELTAVGVPDKKESSYYRGGSSGNGYGKSTYKWYAGKNKKVVLVVDCADGVVTNVIKYYEGIYWTKNGKPDFDVTRAIGKTESKTTNKTDPYNVKDYYDAEDLYEDYYDDFWEYEDAEEYYDNYYE